MRTILLLTLAVGALAAAGCGGGENASGAAGASDDDRQLAFARCMREEGIDIPDPGASGGPRNVRIPRSITPAKMQRAVKTCRDKTGGGPRELSAEEQQEFRDAALAFAQCMRSNGIDLPDPQVGGGSGGLLLRRVRRGSGPDIDPGSPAFRRAEKGCRKLLPGPRRGKDGGARFEVRK